MFKLQSLCNRTGLFMSIVCFVLFIILISTNPVFSEDEGKQDTQQQTAEDKSGSETNEEKSSDEKTEQGSGDELAVEDKDTEEIVVKSKPVQFCQGKYKDKGLGGDVIVTVQCPNVVDNCKCEVEKRGLRESVNCGGAKKIAPKLVDLVSCESILVK